MEQELNYLTNAGAWFNAFDGQPDPERNFTMVFNYMDAFSTYLSTAYTSNRVTQISGAWHDSGLFLLPLGSGLYTYGGNAVAPAAWAEWNATALDLSTRPASIWVTGGYARGDGAWGTTIGKMAFANSAQP